MIGKRAVLGNLPPTGRGVYARDQSVEFLSRFDFIALVFGRGDTGTKGAALRHLGKSIWIYDTGEAWRPGVDHAALVARFEAKIDSIGADGAIADPEAGWRDATAAQAESLRSAIADSIARGYRWGVTSFPSVRYRDVFARSGAWGSPQLYHPQDVTSYETWRALYGTTMIIPSVSTFVHVLAAPEYTFTPDNYQTYLDSLPNAAGSIGWTAAGSTPEWMTSAYLARSPAGNPVSQAILVAGAQLTTPIGLAAVGLVLLVAAAYIFYSTRE